MYGFISQMRSSFIATAPNLPILPFAGFLLDLGLRRRWRHTAATQEEQRPRETTYRWLLAPLG